MKPSELYTSLDSSSILIDDNGDMSGEDNEDMSEAESGEDEEVLLSPEEILPGEPLSNAGESTVPESPTCTTMTPPLTSSSAETSHTENPLVSAGLVPPHLSDIFSTMDTESKPKRRRITKARVLTENEY